MSNVDNEIPQWKKDLIARLRNQNKRTATAVERQQQQLFTRPPQSLSVLVGRSSVQQPILTCSGPPPETVAAVAQASFARESSTVEKCNAVSASASLSSKREKMVQERAWSWDPAPSEDEYNKNSDSDSSEDLRYGPGIVNKLKNKYLSLALRESNARARASILPLRKATSLENILDDDTPAGASLAAGNRLFQPRLNGSNDIAKNAPNRYRNAVRAHEMKRARSVETISRAGDHETLSEEVKPKRESLHEEMLINKIKEGSDKPADRIIPDKTKMLEAALENKQFSRILNKPKRIHPIMNEKEKPPVNVVKEKRSVYEGRPEQRTRAPHPTGEVAAKVAAYKSIIIQAKAAAKASTKTKPPTKVKPVGLGDKLKTTNTRTIKPKPSTPPEKALDLTSNDKVNNTTSSLPSPIPDISRVDFTNSNNECNSKNTKLSETPDLIMTSSPVHTKNTSSSFKISATENFIKEEIRHYNLTKEEPSSPIKTIVSPIEKECKDTPDTNGDVKKVDPQSIKNIGNASNTITFNFAKTANNHHHQQQQQNNVLNANTRTSSPPKKLDINGFNNVEAKKPSKPIKSGETPPRIKSPTVSSTSNNKNKAITSPVSKKPNLTSLEIEKNLINTAKTLEKPAEKIKEIATVENGEDVLKNVPKVKKPPRETENNSIVFKFTDRKDVPDYVHNDGTTRVAKIERPKVGEGGIIILPGASIDESFTDEDEEISRSLEAPPSPCDVIFINDNVLIDGKSSLSQKTKKAKMKISFVEERPEIFEYPSESSLLLIEDMPISPLNAQMGHTVPALTGSSLASYTPKITEDFTPGVTRSVQNIPQKMEDSKSEELTEELLLQEAEQPILFSAGTNTDILF